MDTSGFDDNHQAKDFQRQEISPYFQRVAHSQGDSSDSAERLSHAQDSSDDPKDCDSKLVSHKLDYSASRTDRKAAEAFERDLEESKEDAAEEEEAAWRLEAARKDPLHFKKFLQPEARRKYETLLDGKPGPLPHEHGQQPIANQGSSASLYSESIKHLYQVTLSTIELDKFALGKEFPDLKVFTVFCQDPAQDRMFFQPQKLAARKQILLN